MVKPQVAAQLMSSMGMARLGGASSKASSKQVNKGQGSQFASMEAALLKNGVKNPMQAKKATAGKPGRQFMTKAAGGDSSLGKPKSDVKISAQPGSALQAAWSRNHPGV